MKINKHIQESSEISGTAAPFPGLARETLVWICTMLGALVVFAIVALLLQQVYRPDIDSLHELAKSVLIIPESARPEPMEAMLFMAGIVTILPSLVLFYKLFSKKIPVGAPKQERFFLWCAMVVALLVAVLAYFDFSAQNPFFKGAGEVPQSITDIAGFSNFDFYFSGLFVGDHLWLYALVVVPAIASLFFVGMRKYRWDDRVYFKRSVSVTGYVLTGGVISACILMSVFYFPYSFENKFNFNAVYYSMTQVYAGMPILVDGFTNTYGLYPHFLNPIFHVTGLSPLSFSMVMAILIGLAFLFNLYILNKFVDNKVILFTGIITVIFFPFINFKLGQNFDCNFAFYPIRYIVPATLIFLTALYLRNGWKLLYWCTTALMAVFILWNPEFGMVCYLAWLALNIFKDFYTPEGKINFGGMLVHTGVCVGMVVVVFFMYKLIIQFVYGSSPDLSMLFSTVLVFGKLGFNLLPMNLVHPWNIMAIVLIIGFMYAIAGWYKKNITAKTSMVFLLSVLGTGFFVYFRGRSHNWQLAQSSSMSLILLTVLGDELWTMIRKRSVFPLDALFVLFLFAVTFSTIEVVYNVGKIKEMIFQDEDKAKQADEQTWVESNRNFINDNSSEGEKILVFSLMPAQGLYFDGYKRRSGFNPGQMDMFLKTDISRLEDIVVDSGFNIFIEPGFATYAQLVEPCAALSAAYEFKSAHKTMAMAVKRITKIPAKIFFKREGQILHRKYQDGSEGVRARIKDSKGIESVLQNESFSVEALFYSSPQMYEYAAVVGNMSDSGGFVIHNVLNSSKYFFGINGKGINLPVPARRWVYCVMNVLPGRVDIYINGLLAGTFLLSHPYREGNLPLSIGNVGFMHYYTGAISEVAINKAPLADSAWQKTWNEIYITPF